MKELEAAFAELPKDRPVPERLTRAEQAKQDAAGPASVAPGASVPSSSTPGAAPAVAAVDPYEFFEPVEVLSKVWLHCCRRYADITTDSCVVCRGH